MKKMPLPENEVLFYMKFGEKQWIEPVIDGCLSFSCAEKFIRQAIDSGNTEQGDKFEGVFARLRKDDPRIHTMRTKLGKDLEEINDGDFVFLRRESAKLIPIYCTYALTVGKINQNANVQKAGWHLFEHQPDDRMYGGFSYPAIRNALIIKKRPSFLMIKTLALKKKIQEVLFRKELLIPNCTIEYIDMTQEFFIEPTECYPELFAKSDKYAHQLEYRWGIINKRLSNYSERYNLGIGNFADEKEVYMLYSENGYIMSFPAEFNNEGKVIRY